MANEKILVVDDEEHIAELISYNLSSNGAYVRPVLRQRNAAY